MKTLAIKKTRFRPTNVVAAMKSQRFQLCARSHEDPHSDNPHALTGLVITGCCVCLFFYLIVLAPEFGPVINTLAPFSDPFIQLVTADSLRMMLVVIVAIYLLSGLVKGMAGIGMGLIAVPFVTIFFGPMTAIAVISVPLIITNFWQGVVTTGCRSTIATYSPLAGCMGISMVICSYYSSLFPTSVFSIVLGFITILFVLINLGSKHPVIALGHDKYTQCWVGVVSGIIGGVTGLAAIPLIAYMIYSGIKKDQFVSVLGFLLLISGLSLFAGLTMNNFLTRELLVLSCLASLPALLGVMMGEKLRTRINEQNFRKLVLALVGLIGSKILFGEIVGLMG